MWDLPRPGLEPGSPALAGRFSTTAPPGKPVVAVFKIKLLNVSQHLKIIKSAGTLDIAQTGCARGAASLLRQDQREARGLPALSTGAGSSPQGSSARVSRHIHVLDNFSLH